MKGSSDSLLAAKSPGILSKALQGERHYPKDQPNAASQASYVVFSPHSRGMELPGESHAVHERDTDNQGREIIPRF